MTDRAALREAARINPYAAMAAEAPLAILICAELKLEMFPGNWVLDCSNAAMNILLAAHDMGLGAVWTGVYPNKDFMESFGRLANVPEGVVAHSFIVIGTPDEKPHEHARRAEDRVHKDKW